MPHLACPPPERLAAFLAGRLSDPEFEGVAAHVADCASCAAAPEATGESDPLLAELSGLAECADEPALVRALAALRVSADGTHDRPPRIVREYRLLDRLGRGGMGTVYKALHTRLDKIVALKLLPAERLGSAEARARFEREMKAVGRCNHPRIVQAFDAGVDHGTFFLAMEFVDGIDLSQLVRSCGPLAVADACEIVRQVALGLEHVERLGLVHRDIKPSNLMLTRDGQVKILDLGVARHGGDHAGRPLTSDRTDETQTLSASDDDTVTNLTAAGQVVGTMSYMAPEQRAGAAEIDIRADLYGLGCTLIHLLTGRPPSARPAEKLHGDAAGQTGSIGRQNPPAIRPELGAVLSRMTAESRERRFSTPAELSAAIEPFAAASDLTALARRVLDDESTGPGAISSSQALRDDRSAGSRPRGAVWRRRSTRIAVSLALLFASMAAVALAVFSRSRDVRDPIAADVLNRAGRRPAPDGGFRRSPRSQGPETGSAAWLWQMETAERADPVWSVGWSADGAQLAIAAGARVELRRTATGEQESHWIAPDVVTAIAWNAPRSLIAVADSGGGIGLWKDSGGGAAGRLDGHAGIVTALAWSADGSRLASAGADGSVRLWTADAEPGPVLEPVETDQPGFDQYVTSVAWQPDGNALAIGGNDGRVRLWLPDTARIEPFVELKAPVRALTWNADGSQLITAAGEHVEVWQLGGRPELLRANTGHHGRVTAMAVSNDRMATAGEDGAVRIWTAAGESQLILDEHGGAVSTVAWSPDGRQIAVGLETGCTWLWDVASPTPQLRLVLVPRAPPVLLSETGRVRYTRAAAGESSWHYIVRDATDGKRVLTQREFLRLIADMAGASGEADDFE